MIGSNNKIILSAGQFSRTTRAQLAGAFEAFKVSPQKDRLVLHFHGGLVSEADAETIAERLLPHYRDAALAYPIFTIWQAGLWETLRNNWEEIIKEDVFNRLVERVLQYVLGKLDQEPDQKGVALDLPPRAEVQKKVEAAQTLGKEPLGERNDEAKTLDRDLTPAEAQQFEKQIREDPVLAQGASRLTARSPDQFGAPLRDDIKAAREATSSGEKGLIELGLLVRAAFRILRRCLRRFSDQRDHGIYTTIVEEVAREIKGDLIGGVVWKHMKKNTADAFSGPASTHGGSATLEEINQVHKAGLRPRITLVGHSTGAVYICHFLMAAQKALPADVKFDVIFLAPACTFKLLNETLEVAGSRIAQFRSFGMQDELESGDQLISPFYTRSLLYFVSGLIEEEVDMPLVGMQRYHSGLAPFDLASAPAIVKVRERLKPIAHGWLWSTTQGGLGLSTLSKTHGDFDNDPQTLASVAHVIAKGFA